MSKDVTRVMDSVKSSILISRDYDSVRTDTAASAFKCNCTYRHRNQIFDQYPLQLQSIDSGHRENLAVTRLS
jgi:hypothetical protein